MFKYFIGERIARCVAEARDVIQIGPREPKRKTSPGARARSLQNDGIAVQGKRFIDISVFQNFIIRDWESYLFFFLFFFVSFYTTYFAFSCFSFALDGREKYSFVFDVVLRWIKPHKCLIRDMGHVPRFVKFVIGMMVKMKIRGFQSSLGAPPIEISVTCQYRLTYYRDIFARNVYSKLSLILKRYFLKQ